LYNRVFRCDKLSLAEALQFASKMDLESGASSLSHLPSNGSQARCSARNSTSVPLLHNSDEEYKVLLPFIKDGFEQGQKEFHIVESYPFAHTLVFL
jgi:hypothetical protein